MPFQPILPTWLAVNNANFTSPTALTDYRTGQPFAAGGLNLGDYFDFTTQEASQASDTAIGKLYSGRYRFVQVDSGATVANVKTGTVGYLRAGASVAGVVVTAAGTGATAGTYTIAATAGSGGGSGAIIQVVVGSAGTITSASVVQGGYGYSSVPSFSLTTTSTSGGTVAAQLTTSPNYVTSYDVATAGNAALAGVGTIRPVIFLNSITPGNYGFIQELGVATVLGNATIGTANTGDWVNTYGSGAAGTVTTTAASGSPIGATIGQAVDKPVASNLFKVYMNSVPVVQD
jgi:hypothetical protein